MIAGLSLGSDLLLVDDTRQLCFHGWKAARPPALDGFFERLGCTAARWTVRLERLREGRLLGQFFAAVSGPTRKANPESAPRLACSLRGASRVPRMAAVPASLSSDNCHCQDLTLGLGWPESPAADIDSPGDAAYMPTPSESRVTVSGKPAKVVELLRRRLRLSLGAMMIVVLGIGCVLGWVALRAHVQRDAVAAITTPRRNTRGSVYYDWQFVAGKYDEDARPRGPKWLRDFLGPDVFDTVVIVTIEGDNVDDEYLENVGKLHGVEKVDLVGHAAPELTSAGMAQLWTLPRLKTLNTRGVAIPRGFVTGLAGRTGLRHLWLPQAAVTDDEMAIIGSFTDLEFLQLDGSNVTDRGFAHVANLKKLTILDMPGVRITDLAPVADLVQLDLLVLAPGQAHSRAVRPRPRRPVEPGTAPPPDESHAAHPGGYADRGSRPGGRRRAPQAQQPPDGGEGDHGSRSGPARRIQEPGLPRARRHVDRGLAASRPAPPCDLDPLDGELPSHRRRDRAPVDGDSTHGLDHLGFEDDRRGTRSPRLPDFPLEVTARSVRDH